LSLARRFNAEINSKDEPRRVATPELNRRLRFQRFKSSHTPLTQGVALGYYISRLRRWETKGFETV